MFAELALTAALAAAPAAPRAPDGSSTYYVTLDAPACPQRETLVKLSEKGVYVGALGAPLIKQLGCQILPRNQAVSWSGKKILPAPDFVPTAHISVGHTTLWTYANALATQPQHDPWSTDFLTRPSALVCGTAKALAEGAAAAAHHDQGWLAATGCALVASATPAVRIVPAAASPDVVWQIRLRPQGGRESTVWTWPSQLTYPDGDPAAGP